MQSAIGKHHAILALGLGQLHRTEAGTSLTLYCHWRAALDRITQADSALGILKRLEQELELNQKLCSLIPAIDDVRCRILKEKEIDAFKEQEFRNAITGPLI